MAVIRLKITFWEEQLGWELNAGDPSSSPGKRLWSTQMILNRQKIPGMSHSLSQRQNSGKTPWKKGHPGAESP